MLAVVDLFKEKGTIDDLGFGSLRDAFANILFPGTTTIHTRIKYVLYVPWLLRRAAHGDGTAPEMTERFDDLEVSLIDALIKGGEEEGVIGREARKGLQRTPASIYAGAMSTWGIAKGSAWSGAYFRRQVDLQGLNARAILTTDDPESRAHRLSDGFDPTLPTPPDDFLTSTTFDLNGEQRSYLVDRINASVPDSMLAWLLAHPPANLHDAKTVWAIDNLTDAPAALRQVVDHARRFSAIAQGATLTYNYHLSEIRRDRQQQDADEIVAQRLGALTDWEAQHDAATLRAWEPQDWDTFGSRSFRVSGPTRAFLTTWLDFLNSASRADLTGPDAKAIVERRERQIKGSRAKFSNRSALDRWDGSTTPDPLTFRWTVARRHLKDLVGAVI